MDPDQLALPEDSLSGPTLILQAGIKVLFGPHT